jgi:hypothetical protein
VETRCGRGKLFSSALTHQLTFSPPALAVTNQAGEGTCPQGYVSVLLVSGPMIYDDVTDYDQRGILEGSPRNDTDGLRRRVLIRVLYENPDRQTAIAARFTDAGWVYSPDHDHQAQLACHDGFQPRLVCFGPAEPTRSQAASPLMWLWLRLLVTSHGYMIDRQL